MEFKRRGARRIDGYSTAQQAIVDTLFVYGTLRSGQRARALIADHIVSAEPGTIGGVLFALEEGYPGFAPGPSGRVIGELCRLRDLASAFALLDAYEGENFVRTLQEVTLAAGDTVWAWCYLMRDPEMARGAPAIDGGDWNAYQSTQPL